jgi:hypothetical protein
MVSFAVPGTGRITAVIDIARWAGISLVWHTNPFTFAVDACATAGTAPTQPNTTKTPSPNRFMLFL